MACLKLDFRGQGDGNILHVDGQGVEVLKTGRFSWTSYVYCPLTAFAKNSFVDDWQCSEYTFGACSQLL